MISTRTRRLGSRALLCASLTICLGAGSTTALAQTVYVTNAGSNTVTKISGGVKTTYNVGASPQWIVAAPNGSYVYTANAGSGAPSVSQINTSTGDVRNSVSMGSGTYGLAITADGSTLYAAHAGSGAISKINTSTFSAATDETVGGRPQSLALSLDESRIYVAHFSPAKVSVRNASNMSYIDDVAVPDYAYHLARTPDGNKILATSSYGHLTTFTPSSMVAASSFNIGGNSRAIAVTSDSAKAYVSSYDGGYVDLINLSTGAREARINNVPKPNGMGLSPDGSLLFVANYTTPGTLTVIDTATNSLLHTVEVGTQASSVAVTTGPAWVNPTPTTVPTLTEWAMILFGVALAGFAALTLQRRRQAA